MKLFLIRHAQSANNVLGETLDYTAYMAQRHPEPPLTELGFQQAQLVADHIAATDEQFGSAQVERRLESGYHFTRLLCSPMLRTLQTTLPISRATGLQPEVWPEICEQGGIFSGDPHGGEPITCMPGLTRREMGEQFAGYVLPVEITDAGWWTTGYEDLDGCQRRAVKVAQTLRQWASERSAERLALVSHGTFLEALVRSLLGLTAEHRAYFSHYNTAITRIDFLPDGYLFLRYLNRTQHLPVELLSR